MIIRIINSLKIDYSYTRNKNEKKKYELRLFDYSN